MRVYGDGAQVGEENGLWHKAVAFNFPTKPDLVAIHGVNVKITGAKGIIGSFSTGLVTDTKSWRCIGEYVAGWNTADFDDSNWPQAALVSPPVDDSKLKGQKRAGEAKWI